MVSVLIRINNKDAIVQDFSLLTLVIFPVINIRYHVYLCTLLAKVYLYSILQNRIAPNSKLTRPCDQPGEN